MNTGIRVVGRALLLGSLAALALPGVALAQPVLTAFSFAPATIDTSAGPASVTVNFTLTDATANLSYFEMAFTDSTGFYIQRGFKTLTPSGFVSDSVVVTFPQYSVAGTWSVLDAFASDTAGNTLILNTAGLAADNFQTNLTVTSAVDTVPPQITSFSFSPTTIDTTSASRNVTVNFTATDNTTADTFGRVASVYVGFVSPSGQTTRGARVNAPTDFDSLPSVTSSLVINFPAFSETGTWTVSGIEVVDGAGNTLFLNAAAVASQFPAATTLTVTTSAADTTPPNLTSFSLSPAAITTNGGPVTVNFSVTDDLSGVTDFEILFLSPSAGQRVSGATGIPVSTLFSGSVTVNFPSASEQGTWTTAYVLLADAAGNTALLSPSFTLNVGAPGADTTPPVITSSINPTQNVAGWNNTLPVTVTWSVTDPESGIASTSGCDPTTFTAPTTGTTLTCSATNGATPIPLSNSASVVVEIDIAPPVTSNVLATPDPVSLGTDLTITATITDAGGSNIASGEFQVDGGPFDDLAGPFGGSSANVSVTFPGSHPLLTTPGIHTFCMRGTDFAGNIGATNCIIVAVHGVNTISGGGGTNSPAGADTANPAGSGPVTYGFNSKYGPGDTVPTGNFEFHYKAGSLELNQTSYDFMVVTGGNHAQIQGTGTLNGTSVCKFFIDAWQQSFSPSNLSAFGLRIFNCDGGTTDRYNLPTTPITKGSIQVHQ